MPRTEQHSHRWRLVHLVRALLILGLLALVVAGLALALMWWMGSAAAVRFVHEGLGSARPFVLAGQLALVCALWWYWAPLVRRAKFPPHIEAAWLAARNRLALWAVVLVGLGILLWR